MTVRRPLDPRRVAVLDVGKTNAKVVLHDLATSTDIVVRTRPNTVVRDGPYPHFDVDGLFAFMLEALAGIGAEHPVDAISVTTHGASATLVGDGRLAMPVLDYEYSGPDALAADYDRERPAFSESFTPRLPGGLNVGAQFFWQQRAFPDLFRDVRHIVTYPQYWGWRLTGNVACDVTSLGCHADLWAPRTGEPSSFAVRQGWAALFAPVLSPFDVLGTLTADVAARTGLPAETPVLVGIHDSNASLLPHLMARPAPFSVVSTGTWTISFAVGGSLDGLDPDRDTLANVDAFGRAVPSARTMGGREFDILTGGRAATATDADVASVIAGGVMALPGFVPGCGPYPRATGRWTADPESLTPGERSAAASLYSALMTAECLALIAADGPTVVEGPFARNRVILAALAELTGRPVEASTNATGTSAGAALLALGPDATVTLGGIDRGPWPGIPGFADYAAAWKAALPPP